MPYNSSEKLISPVEKRSQRRTKFVDVVGEYFAGRIIEQQKEQKDRLEAIRQKILRLRAGSVISKATSETNFSRHLESVSDKLELLANDIDEMMQYTEVNVPEREIKKIEAFLKRLEKQMQELQDKTDSESIIENIRERKRDLENQKVLYLLTEFYRTHPDDPQLKGTKEDIHNQLVSLQNKNPDKKFEELLSTQVPDLLNKLQKYLNEYREKTKDSKAEITLEILGKQKTALNKEKARYRRSAQLHSLVEKFSQFNPDNPETTKFSVVEIQQLIKQLKNHIIDLTQPSQDLTDEHIRILRSDNSQLIEQARTWIVELESIIDVTKDQLKAEVNQSTQSIEKRKELLKGAYTQISAKLNTPTEGSTLCSIVELLNKTDYEAQIDKRLESASDDTETTEFIRGFEEFSQAHMREYEQIRTIEREGPIEKREAMAKAFVKSRIMDEFGDTERVRQLYGNSYRQMWEKTVGVENIQSNEEFVGNLKMEVAELYGFDDESIQMLPDPEKAQALQLKEKIYKLIEKITKQQKISEQVVNSFSQDANKQEYVDAIKTDLLNGKMRSNEAAPEERTSDADLNGIVNELFTNEGSKIPPFELIPTPNGIAIALSPDKISTLNRFIFGNAANSNPETLAFTLNSCEKFKELVKFKLGEAKLGKDQEWKGKLLVISSDSDEYTLMHEAQHAIYRSISAEDEITENMEENPNIKFNKCVEEISVRFTSGEIWREIAYPQSSITKSVNLSLLGLGYITPDQLKNPEVNLKIKALYNFVEIAKAIIEEDVEQIKQRGKLNPDEQNRFGDTLAEILMTNLDAQGNFDTLEALRELKTRFADILSKSKISEKKEIDNEEFNASHLIGTDDPEQQSEILAQYNFLTDNPGFTFDVIGLRDIRGRANVAHDYYLDKKIGIEKAGKNVTSLGAILQDVPIIGTPLGEAYAKKKGMTVGATEYEVNDAWFPFLYKRNYKTRNRSFGGIWRKFSHIPFIGDSNEKMTKFGTSPAKLLNDLPPFGRGWEMIMKEVFATKRGKKVKDWIEGTFPGRDMDPIETTRMNATEIWNTMTKELLFNDLGEAGLGLKQDQILRVVANHPMMSIEYAGGQPKHEYTRANLDIIDETGKHKGAITAELVNKLGADVLDNKTGNQFKPKDKREYISVKEEALELAAAMANAYDVNNFPYTVNDLINAAHMCHDLGISGLDPALVRNDYYTKQPGHDTSFERVGNRMVSEFMWYSLENPDIRGVVINDEMFSLEAAHELLRRYHFHFINEALITDEPDMTIEMQAVNKYQIDYGGKDKELKTIDPNPISVTIDSTLIDTYLKYKDEGPFPPTPELTAFLDTAYGWPASHKVNSFNKLVLFFVDKNPADTSPEAVNYRQLILDGFFSIAQDESNPDKYKIYAAKTQTVDGTKVVIKNHFHNPGAIRSPYATTISGIHGNEKLAKRFLNKNMAELDGHIEAVEDGLKYSNEFVRRLAEISQYERMAYYRKTFWGDTKLWLQRIGNIAMLGSLVGAALTGSPFFAALILGTMAIRIPGVIWMSKIESTYGSRRANALQLMGEMGGKMGMYKEMMGKPVSRLDKYMLDAAQSDNESKMEDLAKGGTPEGTYPSGDLAFKFANVVFGEKGLVGRMAGS